MTMVDFFIINENIEFGVEIGYEGFSHEQEYVFGVNEDATCNGSGTCFALTLAVTF